jgi:hypothetical protein
MGMIRINNLMLKIFPYFYLFIGNVNLVTINNICHNEVFDHALKGQQGRHAFLLYNVS